MKNFLPIFGIELPTIQTNSKSSKNISWINITRVLEFKKEKKVIILSILLLVMSLLTVTYFFYAHLILRVMICQLIAGLWEFSFLSF